MTFTNFPAIKSHDHGNGILSIRIDENQNRHVLSPDLIAQFLQALDTARHSVSIKVLILEGTPDVFLHGGREHVNLAISQQLYLAIASFPYPVIASMQGGASGAGFLAGMLCDVMVCSETASYLFGLFPSAAEELLFSARFGHVRAVDFLYRSTACTGKQLQEKSWNCTILPSEQVKDHAYALATNLAKKSQLSLRLLKQHLARKLIELVKSLTYVEPLQNDVAVRAKRGIKIVSSKKHLQVETHAEKVLVLKIRDLRKKYDANALVTELTSIFAQINRHAAPHHAIVLTSEYAGFLPEEPADIAITVATAFRQVFAQSPVPVIAVLGTAAAGLAWLIGQYCDFAVYANDGHYNAGKLLQHPEMAAFAMSAFAYRFGNDAAREILLTGEDWTGSQLRQRVGPLAVTAAKQPLSEGLRLAEYWTTLPHETVLAWKKQHADCIPIPALQDSMHDVSASEPVALISKVITAISHPEGILEITMADREAKNMFSDEFLKGMREVLAHIETTPGYKAVVLSGYDTYFSSGGTKEALVAIQEGKAKFTDDNTYRFGLTCPIPVIAAMQGHAIGGGLSLGLFADFVLLSEESKYMSPYMGYGFTPGAGATLIVPEKLGYDLAMETLLTAQEYAGSELKKRGLLLPVYPRKQVREAAMALARRIAQHPRSTLIALKQLWNRSLLEALAESNKLEIAMHEQTFVGKTNTLKQIQASFLPMNNVTDTTDTTGIVAYLKKLLAEELHMQERDIDENTQFIDLGLDSITGVTWVRKINEKYKTEIAAIKVYSHPTLTELSAYVKEEIEKQGGAASLPKFELSDVELPAVELSNAPKSRTKLVSWRGAGRERQIDKTTEKITEKTTEPIAVIGMAGQFPQARNLDEFWRNIAEGRLCVAPVTPDRWDVSAYYQEGEAVPGKTNSCWMGMLEDYDLFDPLFFNISPTEAHNMDPQQRLFMQACWHSIENAGYNARALSGSKCGVFVGCSSGDYHLLSQQERLSAQGFTGGAASILSARISYFLNLQGPCVAIDTACSSSLVAIAQACDSLLAGNSDLALAGGVYVMTGPEMHIKTAQAGMLSPDGRCYTFDQRANGFVPGEAVGVVLLKRLSDAQRDHDPIHGIIQGWGINQDGKTNGITAPNPESQARLQQDIYNRYRIDPSQIQLIEAHGTGTKLGDPIEVEALKQSFSRYTQDKAYCALGSIKSNIGHCLTAAGIAGFIKLLLAIKHQQLPPAINYDKLNEHIELEGSPFYVNRYLQDWKINGGQQGQRRQAAISSFGFSGTNAHLVIAEYQPETPTTPVTVITQGKQLIVPLSAKTVEQLKQKARDMVDTIQRHPQLDLTEVAYTLQAGREAMEERLALLAGSIGELEQKLQAYIEGGSNVENAYQGQVRRNREGLSLISQDEEVRETIVEKWIAQKKLSKLAEFWVKGLEIDWNRLYGETKPRRIDLPVYPFARERYWIDAAEMPAISPISMPTPISASEISQSLFFEEIWQPQPYSGAATETGGKVTGKVTILFVDAELQKKIASDEKAHSVLHPVFVYPADAYRKISSRVYHCQYDGASDDVRKIIQEVSAEHRQPVSIIYTWAKERKEAGVHALFGLFRAVKASADLVTDVALVGCYDPSLLDACWDYSWIGFERSLKLLLPNIKISLLYTNTLSCTPQQLLDASQSSGAIRYVDEQRFVLSIQPVELNRKRAQEPVLKQNGSYLITGGCGALGLKFARYLAENFQAKLVLLGRRPLSVDMQTQLDKLIQAGAEAVHYQAVDISDREALQAWAQTLPFDISGVFHAAGVESSQAFHEKSSAEIDQVLRPKTLGTLWLDEALHLQSESRAPHPLDFVCYFSSSSALLGDFGSCDYAIANRFQMAYGHYRQQQKQLQGKTVVINWPLWQKEAGQQGGMGQSDPEQAAFYLKSSGQDALERDQGIRIWQDAMQSPHMQTLVMVGKPARIEQFLNRIYYRSIQHSIHLSIPSIQRIVANTKEGYALKERILQELRQLVASSLKMASGRLDDKTNLADYGFDSISLAAFAKLLSARFQLEVTPALFFNHATIEQLAEYFDETHRLHLQALYGQPQVQPRIQPQVQLPLQDITPSALLPQLQYSMEHRNKREPIAIVGMSGRFPQANNIDQLWNLLAEGKSGITEIPRSRWNWRDYFIAPGHAGNTISTNKGGFIDGIDEFDPLFFEVSPREAEEMDPAERILLMEAYHAIEDARMSPASIRGTKTGVFVGMEEGQYGMITDQGVTTAGGAMISSRLSYYLDLHGPAIATNTACSSGLVALHQAVMSLREGECETALVAGLALNLSPKVWAKLSEAGMISQDGECYSFAKKANGIGIGETVIVLMLKPLSAALKNEDHIYGVIKGSGINFDGKTNGVTAPNGRMQAKLIEDVYTEHGIDIHQVSHIVTHGTGTKLGDPVEINALNDAFNKLSKNKRQDAARCALTSCKTNLGHTMAASGLVSLAGLLKGFEHRKIPANLYCEEENDYISWEDSPFYINKATRDWHNESDKPRMGGVSAFGRSGTNAHVVVEEFKPPVSLSSSSSSFSHSAFMQVIVPLSARAEPQLRQKARDLLDFIRQTGQIELAAMAYTLQVGREAMDERLCFIVDSVERLTEKLDAYLGGEQYLDNVFQGTASLRNESIHMISQDDDMKEAIGKWISHNKLSKLAQLWVKGLDVDWSMLYDDAQPKPRRIALPTYPFAKERYWIDNGASDHYLDRKVDPDNRLGKANSLQSIEEIIDKIEDGSMQTSEAVAFLKMVV